MEIAIRTDASHAIGSGHLMRCLALASEMRKVGWKVVFVSSGREKKWIDLIKGKNFECEVIESSLDLSHSLHVDSEEPEGNWQQDAVETMQVLKNRQIGWLIVDHYGLGSYWESALRACTKYIMVIDDLADRNHDCDILVDCVYGRTRDDYFGLVPSKCQMLLGTKYALIRPEFRELRNMALKRRSDHKSIQKILVSLGGVDKGNLTEKVVNILQLINWRTNIELDIVVGQGYQHISSMNKQIESIPFKTKLSIGVNDMATRIINAEFGVGTFGVSTWERFCLGLPSVNIVSETNQLEAVAKLNQLECAGIVHIHSLEKQIKSTINEIVSDIKIYRQHTKSCSRLIDGRGLFRVISEMQIN